MDMVRNRGSKEMDRYPLTMTVIIIPDKITHEMVSTNLTTTSRHLSASLTTPLCVFAAGRVDMAI
jgi:hypothetical protein